MADRVGQQLGNYRLTRLLGRGGFAEVYLGEHRRLKTQAAIKVLHTQLAENDVEGFLKEAQLIASLEHPHIVRVLDFDVEEGTPFLVMSYAPNGTLRQLHPKGALLPLTTIVNYVKQVADALQYAHDEKLIHRDIKPENMLLGRRNEILLSDFGIALIAQSSRYQNTQDMAGTIAYMAPEQIQAHPRPASDQYALGIVVYEWLSGEHPFHGSFTEIAIKHSVVPPPPLREKVPTVLPEVEQVVMTALAKEPRERFKSVQAFANALEQAGQSGDALTFIKPSPRGVLLSRTMPQDRPVGRLPATPSPPPNQPERTPPLHETKSSTHGDHNDEVRPMAELSRTRLIYSVVFLGLRLLFISLTLLAGFFTILFGWSAYLLAIGLVALVIADFIEDIRNQAFIRWSIVIGLVLLWLVVLAESRWLLGGNTGGVIATLLVSPLLGWSPAFGHVLLLGLFAIITIVTFRITLGQVMMVGRAMRKELLRGFRL